MTEAPPTFRPAWWSAREDRNTHEVRVLCICEDIEHCRTEKYVSDVRLLQRELEATQARLTRCQCGAGQEAA